MHEQGACSRCQCCRVDPGLHDAVHVVGVGAKCVSPIPTRDWDADSAGLVSR